MSFFACTSWIRDNTLLGCAAHIHIGPAAHPSTVKLKYSRSPAGTNDMSGEQQRIMAKILDAIDVAIEDDMVVDRGHQHSCGRFVAQAWVHSKPVTTSLSLLDYYLPMKLTSDYIMNNIPPKPLDRASF